MLNTTNTQSDNTADAADSKETALFRALSRLLVPVARLCLANGTTFASVAELLKRAFVYEAGAAKSGTVERGIVSRISTATGINRREVTRLTKVEAPVRALKQPLAADIVARWTTDPAFRNEDGSPKTLSRIGPASSFEALAQAITRDVHPRSLFDELIRLGMLTYDEKNDLVSLNRTDFVPKGDARQMLDFLGENVGDHLNAGVANVLNHGEGHLEQAVFADELSEESLAALRPKMMSHWQALREDLVPFIARLIEADRGAGRTQDRRVRIGLFSFEDSAADILQEPKRVNRRLRTSSTKESLI